MRVRLFVCEICLCLLSMFPSLGYPALQEWIFDNANNSTTTQAGQWNISRLYPGYYSTNYLHDLNTAKGTKSVRFTLTLPSAGNYEVFARWAAASNRANNVPIDIVHGGGTTTKIVDQRTRGGVWVSLGSYTLSATASYVTIRTHGTNGFVIADAIRVVGQAPIGAKPVAGAPKCPTHDDVKWHGLWDASRGCHYDHTHNADPNRADAKAIFGPLENYLGTNTISYPWQTGCHTNAENQLKHNGYKWAVETNLPSTYLTLNWLNQPAPTAIRAIRAQYHFLSTNDDARVRLHSFWAEMQVCPANSVEPCGIVRGGGFWDTGILHVPYKNTWVPLPGQDPPGMEGVIWRPGVDTNTSGLTIDPYRAHGQSCADSGAYTGQLNLNHDNTILWTSSPGTFGYNKHMGLAIIVLDAMGCVEPTDTSKNVRLCPDGKCRFNGSEHLIFTLFAYVNPALDGGTRDSDGKKNGRVTFKGFTDKQGNISDACFSTGGECVPYSLENAPIGWAAWDTPSNSGRWEERLIDHDVSPPGEWWITGPN